MAHARKTHPTEVAEPSAKAPDVVKSADIVSDVLTAGAVVARPSPARQLQRRLHVHFSPLSREMTGRFVTLLVMFTTIGTWLAGTAANTVL